MTRPTAFPADPAQADLFDPFDPPDRKSVV